MANKNNLFKSLPVISEGELRKWEAKNGVSLVNIASPSTKKENTPKEKAEKTFFDNFFEAYKKNVKDE